MAEAKTKPTRRSVRKFLEAVESEKRREDSLKVLEIMKKITGEEPRMWGPSIVGFGTYHYKYASGREGDWPVAGFSPRKQALTLYIMAGFDKYDDLMAKLGKYKIGKSCLYVNKLEDIHLPTLERLIRESVKYIKRTYES